MLLLTYCPNVCIEPQLQHLSGETLSHHTSNSDDHTMPDWMSLSGVFGIMTSHEQAFLVFIPLAKSHLNQ